MADKSYLKLYRQILNWEWHEDAYAVSLFIHLLAMANYLPDYKFRGKAQRVGELHTSLPKLAAATGMHINTVDAKLKQLQSTGEIEVKTSNKGVDIYICQFAKMQAIKISSGTPSGTLDVPQDVMQDVPCDVVQDVPQGESAEDNAENAAGITLNVSQDVSQRVSPNVSNQDNIDNIRNNNILTKRKSKKEKVIAENATATPSSSTAELEAQFDAFRKTYRGTKRGLTIELENLQKKNENWREIIPLLMPALEREIAWREQQAAAGRFVPEWAYLQTWINQKRWQQEFEAPATTPETTAQAGKAAPSPEQPPKDDEYGGSFGGMDV